MGFIDIFKRLGKGVGEKERRWQSSTAVNIPTYSELRENAIFDTFSFHTGLQY